MSVYPTRPWPGTESDPVTQQLWYLDRVSHLVRLATDQELDEAWTRRQEIYLRAKPYIHVVSWWQTQSTHNSATSVTCIQATVCGKCCVTWDPGINLIIDPGMPDQEFTRRVRAVTEMLETATWI